MKYQIIVAYEPEKLEGLVNNLISADWKPIGGVSVAQSDYYSEDARGTGDNYAQQFVQAMIRE